MLAHLKRLAYEASDPESKSSAEIDLGLTRADYDAKGGNDEHDFS